MIKYETSELYHVNAITRDIIAECNLMQKFRPVCPYAIKVLVYVTQLISLRRLLDLLDL